MKFYPLALLAVLMAAATASAGDGYSYGNSLAGCGCQGHSWVNGCCSRQSSCADHLWDDYCASRPACGCGCGMNLPCFNWNSLHMNAAPYQVPCLRLPKLQLNRGCTAGCCSAAPGCDDGCCGGASVNHGISNGAIVHEAAPVEAEPLPPAPTTEDMDMKKPTDKKKKDNKTASLWLFPSLSL